MTIEEKAYDEALEQAKKELAACGSTDCDAARLIFRLFPQFRESEDEKIRRQLIEFISDIKRISESGRSSWAVRKDDAEMCNAFLTYLEKLKDASKAIEAVEKIDKYIDEHLANAHDMKDSNPDKKYYRGWDDALGKMAGILQDVYSGEKQKESLRDFIDNFPYSDEQKEPHYIKRNALFDKCVENCAPKTVEEVNKRIDDIVNMSELSAFEQALTNFIGYWEDDEEKWPSKFVKKHGKHILDMAREELKKEQKPVDYDHEMWKNCEANFEGGKKEVIEHPEKYGLQKEQKPISFNEPYNPGEYEVVMEGNATSLKRKEQKPAEKQDYSGLTDLERAIHRGFLSAGVENVPVTIIKETAKECLAQMKPAEWDYDNRIQYDSVKSGIKAFASTYSFNIESKLFPQLTTKEQQQIWREEIEQAAIAGGESGVELSRDNRYKENRMIEWSEEDKDMLNSCISSIEEAKENRYAYKETDGDTSYDYEIDWLKSLCSQTKQEWSEKDERTLIHIQSHLKYLIEHRFKIKDYNTMEDRMILESEIKWLENRFKYLCPVKQEWSEDDKRILYNVIAYVGYAAGERGVKDDDFKEANEWLKNLRYHTSLKPSEEQMDALKELIDDAHRDGWVTPGAAELYAQLKKLM